MNMRLDKCHELFVLDTETGILYWRDLNRRLELGDCVGYISYTNGRPYIKVNVYGAKYFVHQIIWLYVHGVWPNEIDHVDGNTLNNKPTNLRDGSHAQNMANIERKFHGVEKHGNKFRARIDYDGSRHELGSFITREEAEEAYKQAHIARYGEYSIYKRKQA